MMNIEKYYSEENENPLDCILSKSQMQKIRDAEEFYTEVCDIIRHGKSIVYRTEKNVIFRYPTGTQAVLRYADDGERALLVYHTFEHPKNLHIPVEGEWKIDRTLYKNDRKVTVTEQIVIHEEKSVTGNVLLLKKDR